MAVTLLGCTNILLGLVGLASAGAIGYFNASYLIKVAEAQKKQSQSDWTPPTDEKGNPKLGGPAAPPREIKAAPPLVRPAPVLENPVGYFRDRQRYLLLQEATYEIYAIGGSLIAVVLALVLLASGAGLLALRKGGRILALLFAVLGPLAAAGSVAYATQSIIPEVERWERGRALVYRGLGEEPTKPDAVTVVWVHEGLNLAIGVGYALIMGCVLLMPGVRGAFKGPPAPLPSPADPDTVPSPADPDTAVPNLPETLPPQAPTT